MAFRLVYKLTTMGEQPTTIRPFYAVFIQTKAVEENKITYEAVSRAANRLVVACVASTKNADG